MQAQVLNTLPDSAVLSAILHDQRGPCHTGSALKNLFEAHMSSILTSLSSVLNTPKSCISARKIVRLLTSHENSSHLWSIAVPLYQSSRQSTLAPQSSTISPVQAITPQHIDNYKALITCCL